MPEIGETVRSGVNEPAVDPALIVGVEKLSIRYELDHIWIITDHSSDRRYLSCCLNLTWPDGDTALDVDPDHAETTLRSLNEVFDALRVQSRAVGSNAAVTDGRFAGWLSYATGEQASAAFGLLREMLHAVNLNVRQWSRDLVIPRQLRNDG